MGGLPAILGDWFHPWCGLRQGCLGGPAAGMVSAVTRTGLAPGRHVFHRGLPRTSPCRRTAAGRGRPGALQGRAAGRPPCGGCACWGPSQWAVWTGVRGGPTSGSSAREREEPAGPLPVVGGGQGLPAEARRSDHSNRKSRGTGTWPGACGARRAQTLLRLFLGAGGTGRKAPAESGPGRADGGPGGEEDGLRPGDGASWQGPSGCASAQKAGSWVEPGLAAGERVPG